MGSCENMKNVDKHEFDSFRLNREYICVRRSWSMASRETKEEYLPIMITWHDQAKQEITGKVDGEEKPFVFKANPRGLWATDHYESHEPQTKKTLVCFLMRDIHEWPTLEYMRELASELRDKMGANGMGALDLYSLNYDDLTALRDCVYNIERNKCQRIDYKGFSAGIDSKCPITDEYSCSFFDDKNKRVVFHATHGLRFTLNFRRRVDAILASQSYYIGTIEGKFAIIEKATNKAIAQFEDENLAYDFMKELGHKLIKAKELQSTE